MHPSVTAPPVGCSGVAAGIKGLKRVAAAAEAVKALVLTGPLVLVVPPGAGHSGSAAAAATSTLPCMSWSICFIHSGMETYSMGTSSARSARLNTYLIF